MDVVAAYCKTFTIPCDSTPDHKNCSSDQLNQFMALLILTCYLRVLNLFSHLITNLSGQGVRGDNRGRSNHDTTLPLAPDVFSGSVAETPSRHVLMDELYLVTHKSMLAHLLARLSSSATAFIIQCGEITRDCDGSSDDGSVSSIKQILGTISRLESQLQTRLL